MDLILDLTFWTAGFNVGFNFDLVWGSMFELILWKIYGNSMENKTLKFQNAGVKNANQNLLAEKNCPPNFMQIFLEQLLFLLFNFHPQLKSIQPISI